MKFTESWLREHLDTTASTTEIATKLTMIGLEMEELIDLSAELKPFIVGHVLEAEPHPDADRLRVLKVDTGTGVIQVVCGAPNARAGLKGILARPGVVIPASGETLGKGKIRGIESQGMMCSARELKLGDDHAGIIELDTEAPAGTPADKVLNHDPVFHIAVTPNRADCLGVRGVARDLAAVGLGALKDFAKTAPVPGTFKSPVAVGIDLTPETRSACPQFVGRYIRGVTNGQSPHWVKERLTAIGLRSISALVDVTNLISYEFGRPLHVFDAAKISGPLRARLARPGETLLALDGTEYALGEGMIVIADDAGPQAIAGVMGGLASGCTETTTEVIVEAALFDPIRIAMAGRKLGIDSDARYRFERGVDPASCVPGAEYATRLILEWCGGEASELLHAGAAPDWNRAIVLRPERVEQRGGVSLPTSEIERILKGLGCTVAEHGAALLVNPPSWRGDIGAEHDLVEEVIRVYGYDAVPPVPLPRDPSPKPVLTPAQRRAGFVRRELASRGLREAATWSFLPRAHAALFGGGGEEMLIANPISADLDCMRPSILPNLIAAAGRNADRGFADLGLFEVGPQFFGEHPGEQQKTVGGIRAGRIGDRHWAQAPRAVDAFDAKADALAALAAAGAPAEKAQVVAEAPAWYHPGRSGALRLGPVVLATFGEVHPGVLKAMDVKGPVVAFEVFLDALPEPKAKATKARSLFAPSPFQAVKRDFAFLLDSGISAGAVVKAAASADKALIADVAVFDLYEGDKLPAGKKSLAIAVTLQPTQGTLTDAEIEAAAAKIVSAVVKATGGELRG